MHTASLGLSKQLFEVSGWDDTSYYYANDILQHGIDTAFKKYAIEEKYPGYCPAYDLGYLLRKLPHHHPAPKENLYLTIKYDEWEDKDSPWLAVYADPNEGIEEGESATTPEDAAAKLCIELFKQGILKKGA